MLKIITMLTMFVAGHLAQAQITESRTLAPFTKIDVTDGVEIILTPKGPISVNVASENNGELINVITEIKGNTLKVSKVKNNGMVAKVYISAAGISSITASLKSKVTVNDQLRAETITISMVSGAQFCGNIKSEKLTLKAKSCAVFKGRIETDKLSCIFKNGATVILSGNAQKTVIRTDSGAICSARNFISNNMAVNAGNFSSVIFTADAKVRITMSPTSKVRYYGHPEIVEIPTHAMINKTVSDKLLTSN